MGRQFLSLGIFVVQVFQGSSVIASDGNSVKTMGAKAAQQVWWMEPSVRKISHCFPGVPTGMEHLPVSQGQYT